VDLGASELAPCYDPASHLVYAAGREHVSHVWVAGEVRVENGQLLHPSNAALLEIARSWRNRLV
jgi:5-methylthioadenosine/S-adenosylhomocysteine deaminase